VAGNQLSSDRVADTQEKNNLVNSHLRKDEHYLTIYGWMTNQLKLSGNELLVYGLIYSFAKDGTTEFHGSADYIASALNMSRRTVVSTLKSLTNKGQIKKRITGRYCHYSLTSVQNLHTSSAEIAQVSVQNLRSTCANSSHHIKSIYKVNNKSSSEPTTTVLIQQFIDASKKAGFVLDNKVAASILAKGLSSDWIDGSFNFLDYVAGYIKESYPNKSKPEQKRLFISALGWDDLQDEFPEWKKTREAEASAREERRRQETEEQEKRRLVDQARADGPKTCGHCGAPIAAPGGLRGTCPSCNYDYFFNEESEKWEYSKSFNLVAEYKRLKKGA
jgi:DNA-binding MarR family transcriptional regulator